MKSNEKEKQNQSIKLPSGKIATGGFGARLVKRSKNAKIEDIN